MRLSPTPFRCFAMVTLAAGFTALEVAADDRPAGADPTPLSLAQTIELPMLTGGMNHLAADATRSRFFITVPGARQTVVIDLKGGKVLRTLSGPAAAACFVPDLDLLCVAGDQEVSFYHGPSLTQTGKLNLHSRLDEMRYAHKEHRLYVGMMDPNKPGIAVIDVPRRKLLAALPLPAKPQGFVVESAGTRIYANTPAAGQVTVVDRKARTVVANWKLTMARSNYPIALDEKNHRLFVGCRRPPRLLVLDASSGKMVATVNIGGDADDMSFDPLGQRVYVACGDGVITSLRQAGPDHYDRLGDTATAPGTRNSLFVARLRTFFVAVPQHGRTPAQLRAYQPRK
ncbi:MAG TPA: hypothetical protein VFA18_02045 [Gemmataceae bacterium]|nr:hypothetical protein [Gemmataceae bacterium]